jgi:hypothetical protein
MEAERLWTGGRVDCDPIKRVRWPNVLKATGY